jgi:hypothetical protein
MNILIQIHITQHSSTCYSEEDDDDDDDDDHHHHLYWNMATSCFVDLAMSKAHWITCWVTKP